jgi:hypothetical protein
VSGFLTDPRALLAPDDSADPWRERAPWPEPPLHDLESGSTAALCINCSLIPVDRRCPECPRISTRLYREWRSQPPLPRSRWARLLTVFARRV